MNSGHNLRSEAVPLAILLDRNLSHESIRFADTAGEKYRSFDRTERGSGIRNRHGGQLDDARARLSGRHKALRSLRKRLRHRRRGVLSRLRNRYVSL